jgi:hypothetical protein
VSTDLESADHALQIKYVYLITKLTSRSLSERLKKVSCANLDFFVSPLDVLRLKVAPSQNDRQMTWSKWRGDHSRLLLKVHGDGHFIVIRSSPNRPSASSLMYDISFFRYPASRVASLYHLPTSISGVGKRLRLLFCAQCEKIIVLHEHNLRTSIIEYYEAAMTSIFLHIAQK